MMVAFSMNKSFNNTHTIFIVVCVLINNVNNNDYVSRNQ